MLTVSSRSSLSLLSAKPDVESGILNAMGDEANNQMGPSGVQLTPATTTPAANGGSAIRPRIEVAVSNEPPMKRIKVEQTGGDSGGSMILNSQSITVNDPNQATMSEPVPASQPIKTVACGQNVEKEAVSQIAVNPASVKQEQSSGSVVTNSSIASSSSASAGSLCAPTAAGNSKTNLGAVSQPVAPPNPIQPAHSSSALGVAPSAPLKSTTMAHLRTKYTAELEYMLREFRKLERQLLGAKGAAQIEESVGSRERREKLHSFILHLEDTIRQIETGCRLEAEGKNTVGVAADASQTPDSTDAAKKQMAETSALTNLTKEKEEEENVQKLEEHILANLLPVKVRLKKQLAAQQGATKNPAGMPAPRRGLQPVASNRGKGTFAAAAEEKRKQAEAARLAAEELQRPVVSSVSDPTQFGTPLGGGGSSLTQKLHGATLGSKTRIHGYGVGTSSTAATRTTPEKKILYAGMVPGSSQHHSGVAAAFGVHDMVIKNPNLKTIVQSQPTGASKPPANVVIKRDSTATAGEQISEQVQTAPLGAEASFANADKKALLDQNLTEEERKKLRKHRRKRKLQRIARRRERERQRQLALHQQQTGSSKMGGVRKKTIAGKSQGKKKGPRAVEYICALCSEAYNSTCDYNPWWALAQHECHKCRKNQIPRIDITSPANQIEYHPALLAHAEDNGGGEDGGTTNVNVIHMAQPQTPSVPFPSKPSPSVGKDVPSLVNDSDSDSDLSELSDGSLSDCTLDSSDSATDLQSMTPAEVAEHERFGEDYKGPILSDNHASRLLVLMAHASTCPCKHKLTKHRDVCKNTKYLMLHVRDCPGTTSTFDVCPFPWCRKVKHLLYHLVSCTDPKQCGICSPTNLSKSLQALVGLNGHRLQKYREQMIAATKVAATAKPSKGIPVIPKAGKRAVKMVPTTSAPSPQKQPDIQCLAPAKQETFSTPAQSYLPHPGAPENLKLHQHSVSAPGHSPQSQTHLPVPAPASAHAPPAASQPQATTIVATHVSVAMAHPPTATTQPGSQPEPTASIMLQPPVATTQQTVSQPQPMICQPTSQLPPATHNPETQLQPTGTQSQVAQTVQPPTSSQPVQPTVIAAAIHQASHQQPAVPQSGPAFIQSQNEVPAPVITAYQAAAVTQVAIQPQPIVAQLPIVTAQQDSAAPPAAIQPASKTQPVVTHSPVVTAQQVHPASRVQSVVVQPSVASQVQPVVTQPVVAAQQAALAVPPAAIQPASQVQPVVAKLPLVSTQQPLVVAQPATIQPASQAAVAQPSNQSQPVATQLQTAVVQPSIMATQQTSGAATSAPSGQPQSAPIQPSNVTPDAAAHQQIAHPQTATAQSVTTTQQTSVTTAPISLQPVTVADGDVVASQEVPGPAQPAPSGPRTAKVQPHSAATLPESQPPTVDTQLPVSTHEAPSATEPGQSQPASQLQALAHQSVTQPPSQQATSDPSKVTEPLSTQELNQSDAPSTVTTEQAAAQNTEGLNYPPVQANDGSAAGESITGSPATATSVVSATDESPSVQLAVSQPPSAVEPVATTATAKEIATPDAVVLLDQETDSAPPSPTTTTATATAANNTHHTAGKVEQTVEVN